MGTVTIVVVAVVVLFLLGSALAAGARATGMAYATLAEVPARQEWSLTLPDGKEVYSACKETLEGLAARLGLTVIPG